MIKPNQLANVTYRKGDEITDRSVIVTYVPTPKTQNVKALDVTHFSPSQQQEMLEAWKEYQEYLDLQRKTLFAFEDFIAQTAGHTEEIKWRTFKPDQLTERD